MRLVWNLDPESQTATVHPAGVPPSTVGVGGELDGGDVLPGFRLPLAELLA